MCPLHRRIVNTLLLCCQALPTCWLIYAPIVLALQVGEVRSGYHGCGDESRRGRGKLERDA